MEWFHSEPESNQFFPLQVYLMSAAHFSAYVCHGRGGGREEKRTSGNTNRSL
jgi:hypothetical protein